MGIFLIYPPFADPTQPYLALPALKGHLRARGFDATVVDLNVEAVHYLLGENYIRELAGKIGSRFRELDAGASLSLLEQWEYGLLCGARRKIKDILCGPPAIDVFRDKDAFYDYGVYSWARERMNDFFACLNAAYFPYEYGFNQAEHIVAPWNFGMLDRYFEERRSPAHSFYEGWLRRLSAVRVIGISLTFVTQIPEAFYLCRLVEKMLPQALRMLGGPAISQILSQVAPDTASRILRHAHGVCLFEGEDTLTALLERGVTSGDKFACVRDLPNVWAIDPASGEIHRGPLAVTDVSAPALPDYSDLDLDRYLAPSRTLLYAPTRGCYWNKCSFCYYGFNQSPKHRYREVPADKAAEQIVWLAKRHGVRNFYLSCDVLAPAYALRLAEIVAEHDLFWSTDLKIEKYYTPDRCGTLFRSGLRAVAFGVESGSDRMLELMNKGISTALIAQINRNFHEAGIATAWMAFTSHPGEKFGEAAQTVSWLRQNRFVVDLFIIGEFGLTPGSDIAMHPDRYGVTEIYYMAGDELRLFPLLNTGSRRPSARERERLDADIDNLALHYTLSRYPWAGSISTHHTFLYLLRFGQRALAGTFKDVPPHPPAHTLRPAPRIPGLQGKPGYSLARLENARTRFLQKYARLALRQDKESRFALLSLDHFLQEAGMAPSIPRSR